MCTSECTANFRACDFSFQFLLMRHTHALGTEARELWSEEKLDLKQIPPYTKMCNKNIKRKMSLIRPNSGL